MDDEISPHVRVYELEDIKKRTDETINAHVDCICQLAHRALIGNRSDAGVEFEAQCRLIHAIPGGDIELQKELLKVGCDKCVSQLLEIYHTYYAIESGAATMCWQNYQCSIEVPLTSNTPTEASLTMPELHTPAPTWT